MPTWTLHTEFTFDAAHYIDGYDGKCGRMHGHTYKVHISAKSHQLNPSKYLKSADMVCDFRELKWRSEEHTSELQSRGHLVCRLLLEKKKKQITNHIQRDTSRT